MRCTQLRITWFLFAILLMAPAVGGTPAPYEIPILKNIQVDGNANDWGDSGFRVELLSDPLGQLPKPTNFWSKMQLGWDQEGLLVLMTISDDKACEELNETRLFRKDSVEFFMAPALGARDYFMTLIAPGIDPNHQKLRIVNFDKRGKKEPALKVQVATKKLPDGYQLEARLPWTNLGISPAVGSALAFQVYVVDGDESEEPKRFPYRATWHPRPDVHTDRTSSMYPLKLSLGASAPVEALVRGRFRRVQVVGLKSLAGLKISARRGSQVLCEGTMEKRDYFSQGTLMLPASDAAQSQLKFEVFLENRLLEEEERPGANSWATIGMREGHPAFEQYVFDGDTFPKCTWMDPATALELLGNVKLNVQVYDQNYQPVSAPKANGRYGAVVEVVPEFGRPSTRFFTLYKVDPDRGGAALGGPFWALPPQLQKQKQNPTTRPAHLEFEVGEFAGVLQAARQELGQPKLPLWDDQQSAPLLDRVWWLGLQARLEASVGATSQFHGPREEAGPPAPVITRGTALEARMKPQVEEKLDEVCRKWAASDNFDGGFSICISRRGTLFYQKVFNRPGTTTPLTPDTPAPVTSLNKVLNGILTIMMCEQGLLDLDAPVAKYIPVFAKIADPSRVLTVRHLYTHTVNYPVREGLLKPDFEHILADSYRDWEFPVPHSYNDTGYALAGRILERLGGDVDVYLIRKHIMAPLEMKKSYLSDSYSGLYAVAEEYLRVGQLLLNHGKYGNLRFFSEASFEKMLPAPLISILGFTTDRTWGIGLWGNQYFMFNKGEFGHMSANSSFLWVDPKSELIVVTCGNDRQLRGDALKTDLATVLKQHLVELDEAPPANRAAASR